MKKQLMASLVAAVVALGMVSQAQAWMTWAGNGNEYLFIAGNVSWTDAQTEAHNQGGYLASITSADENTWVYNNVVPSGIRNQNNEQVWLGGYQKNESALPAAGWSWDSGEAWSYTAWAGSEPNDSGPGLESYLTINRFGNWTWNDAGVNSSAGYPMYGYIVEKNNAANASVPDGGFSLVLLGASMLSLGVMRRKLA
jgi:hypothetical protein